MEEKNRDMIILRIIYVLFVFTILIGCTPNGPQKIMYGKENCYSCKMTIVDNRFAAEIVNKNRKAYKFDDLHCLTAFLLNGEIKQEAIFNIYVNDFSHPGVLIAYDTIYYLRSPMLRSPMGANIAAFGTKKEMEFQFTQMKAEKISKEEIFNIK